MTAGDDPTRLDARAIAAAVRAGERRAADVVEAHLARIEARNDAWNAFLAVDAAGARRAAAAVDATVAEGGDPGPLAGVPLAIKDNLCVRGTRTTCASRILETYVAPYTATAVERLVAAGAVPIGKTNLDEFAMGSSNESSAFGATRNPWDPTRVPGGSSGGSAAAVAGALAPVALGSDTGGSIRQPAALCGVVGVKPTYGRVSRYGLLAFASSLDQIGPFAKTVRDAAAVLGVLAGRDPRDATSVDLPPPEVPAEGPLRLDGVRLGVPEEYLPDALDPVIRARFDEAVATLESLGATMVPLSLPSTPYAIPVYYVLANAEASSNLARYDGVRYGHRTAEDGALDAWLAATRGEGFGAETKRRIMIGTFVLSTGYADRYYTHALRVRALLRRELATAFERVDAIVSPTSPVTAFPLGEKVDDPISMYLCDVLTAPANLAGVPGVSVPGGYDDRGLPVGLQFLGPHFGETELLRIAAAYEDATGHAAARSAGDPS